MADNFDLKFQEIKNSIYFLAETLEKKYAETNAKIDQLAESIGPFAAAVSAGGAPSAAPDRELREAVESLGKKVAELPAGDLKKVSEAATRLSAAMESQAKEAAKRDEEIAKQLAALAKTDFAKVSSSLSKAAAATPAGLGEKLSSLSTQVAELKKQNAVLIDAVNLLVSELETVKAAEHRA